jgi:hydrogenase maturation protease
MRKVAVFGCGNLLRQDDGAGIRIVQAVARHWGDRISVAVGQQPLPEWTTLLGEVDVAFVVDATRAGRPRPRVRRLCPSGSDPILGGHRWGPRQLLQMTLAVYGGAPETYLVLVPAAQLGFGEDFSALTARATDQALRLLDRLIGDALSDGEPCVRPPPATEKQFPRDRGRRAHALA